MNHTFGRILTRIAAGVGLILLIGVIWRLLILILQQVLPPALMSYLSAGFSTLMSMVGPSLGPLMAGILILLGLWVFLGRR